MAFVQGKTSITELFSMVMSLCLYFRMVYPKIAIFLGVQDHYMGVSLYILFLVLPYRQTDTATVEMHWEKYGQLFDFGSAL